MAITRSKTAERAEIRRLPARRPAWRLSELLWTLGAALFIASGLYLVYQAKSAGLMVADQGLAARRLVNLNELSAREDLLPALGMIGDQRARQEAARQIYYLSGGLSNVGAARHLLTGDQFRQFKPLVVVRRPAQFQRAFFLW